MADDLCFDAEAFELRRNGEVVAIEPQALTETTIGNKIARAAVLMPASFRLIPRRFPKIIAKLETLRRL